MIVSLRSMPSMGDLDPNAILAPDRDTLGNETDQLLARIQQLGQDWFNADDNSGVSADLLARWNAFVANVTSWDAGPRILAHIINSTWRDELLAYQVAFNGFLAEFRSAGISSSTTAFTFTPAAPSTLDKLADAAGNAANKALDPLKKGLDTIETVAIVGGVVLLGAFLYLTFETGRTVRSVGPELARGRLL